MDGVKRGGLSDAAAGWTLLIAGIVCAGFLMVLPRPIVPTRLPTLTLPADAVAAQVAADGKLAAREPGEVGRQLEAMLMEQGEAEAAGMEDAQLYRTRRKALRNLYKKLLLVEGQEAALALRARATARFDDALDLKLPAEEAPKVIGAMASVFEREGVAHEGHLVAPRFVVRTLFKARWNLLHGLEPHAHMQNVELRAFHGWRALHSEQQALGVRVTALRGYSDLGGTQIEEALGALLYRAGDFEQSAGVLRAAHAHRASLRLRNHALAAELAGASAAEGRAANPTEP